MKACTATAPTPISSEMPVPYMMVDSTPLPCGSVPSQKRGSPPGIQLGGISLSMMSICIGS
jgi:hypothetical protein